VPNRTSQKGDIGGKGGRGGPVRVFSSGGQRYVKRGGKNTRGGGYSGEEKQKFGG